MIVPGSANSLLLAQGAATGYNLTKSLRFRSSAGAYLNRTPATASNRRTWTWSAWVKRGKLGVEQNLFAADVAGSDDTYLYVRIGSNDTIYFSNQNANLLNTSQVFRDTGAWYHLVLTFDTTQATASNRIKMYVNGVQITAFANTQYPVQNFQGGINNNVIHKIGTRGTDYFDGYMAEQNFIDGQALTPSSFGENNATTGVWQPKKYTGTYGTNGFYLPFTNTSSTTTLGYDFSGNSNNWTTNNISLTAGATYDSMTDVPTLTDANTANYCVINAVQSPVVTSGGTYSIINGNLYANAAGATKWMSTLGTFSIAPGSGKWYFEFTSQQNSGDYSYAVGMFNVNNSSLTNPVFPDQAGGYGYLTDGRKDAGGTYTSYGATWGVNGDTIGVAIDASGATTSITFYKNNVSQGVAFSGLTGTYAPAFGNAGANGYFSVNFGQQGFKYTPPTGYVALNTYNLPTSTIVAGNKYMDATTYTGTGSTQTIANAGAFKPDLVWLKSRTGAYVHILTDSVRGADKQLISNNTNAEATNANIFLTSFNSNGFTVGTDSVVNQNTYANVGWQWQAGQGTTSSNTNGSITSTVSVNASAGFSVVTFTLPGSGGPFTVGHGLGVAPSMIILKSRTQAFNWAVYHVSLGNTQKLSLNLTDAASAGSWNSTSPTSSVFSLGTAFAGSGDEVAYCWTPIAGFSAFGSYTGNGSSDGPFTYTGFRPKFLMIKNSTTGTTDWFTLDTSRDTYNICTKLLRPNTSQEEQSYSVVDILSNGFKQRNTYGLQNTNGDVYIYAAFAENPFKNALAR